jgi:hypothetical protein
MDGMCCYSCLADLLIMSLAGNVLYVSNLDTYGGSSDLILGRNG